MFGQFGSFRFDRLVFFSPAEGGDPPADDPEEDAPGDNAEGDDQPGADDPKGSKDKKPNKKKVEFNQEQQEELNRRAAIIRREAEEKGKLKAKAEFEAEQKRLQEETEKEALKKKGEFETIAKQEEEKRKAAEAETAKIKAELQSIKLKGDFSKGVSQLGLEFINEQAEQDAFAALDLEIVGEDGAGMKKAIEKLSDSRSYYFQQIEDEEGATDAKQRGKKPTNEKEKKEREVELKQRFRFRRSR